jgi:2-polyprenyl-3-methyl-5-hydroxy-6-metoxy-1,4-benzoquinol methylase
MMKDYYSSYTSTQSLADHDEAFHTRLAADHLRSNLLPHLPAQKNTVIIDVACGYGAYLKALSDLGYTNCHGVDISREQIAYARERLGLKNASEGDGLAFIKKNSGTAEAILLLDILEHLSNDEVIEWLQSCRVALKPGGVLIIQVPNAMTPVPVLFHGDFTHQRAYSPNSMSQALRLAGFTNFRHYPAFDSPLRPLGLLRRLLWRILNPLLALIVKVLYGSNGGGIFTGNLISIVRGPRT